MDAGAAVVLDRYGIDGERGFLPSDDPLDAFSADDVETDADRAYLRTLDRLAASLPDRLDEGSIREAVQAIDPPSEAVVHQLDEPGAIRLCQLAGFLASGYVHQIDSTPVERLPSGVAMPLYHTSVRFGRKPILSYDLLCLHNFRRVDPSEPLEVENIRALTRFTDLPDEDWFVAIHVAIEAAAGQALIACAGAQRGVIENDSDAVEHALDTIGDSLDRQTEIMRRMTEGNAPEAFVSGFRPYYAGFDGIVFEGVDALRGAPQVLRGGSGAQSSAVPSIDAALGVDHAETALVDKLHDMRSYMPNWHREVIHTFEIGPDVRSYVADHGSTSLREGYNRCVRGLSAFREVHFKQVAQYVAEMGETTGTGGTDYMSFLPKMKHETEAQQL